MVGSKLRSAMTRAAQRVHVTDLTVLQCMHAVFYIQYQAILFTSNEHGCLGRDLCCSVNCHPSRLMQCTRLSCVPSVSTEIHVPQTLKELMITSMATDSQAFFTHWRQRRLSGALILPAARACSAGSIQGRV